MWILQHITTVLLAKRKSTLETFNDATQTADTTAM
jgi:hypothetical protein